MGTQTVRRASISPPPIRVVLDTNVLVSALLFSHGRLSWLRQAWQSGQLTPVLAKPTALELIRVLAYPKFRLSPPDQERLLEEVLPWSESWKEPIPRSHHRVNDPNDQVFLDLALAATTPVLVSGDSDLLALRMAVLPLLILNPSDFQAWWAEQSRSEAPD